MQTFNQPNSLPLWCHDNDANVIQPPASLRESGWAAGEPVPAQFFNAILQGFGDWIGYLNQANGATVMAATLDLNTRLVGGGNWSFSVASGLLKWDDTAYLSIPSIPLADNAMAAGSVALGANQVAFVTANAPYTTSGGLTSGDTHVTGLASTSAIAVGQSVSGAGVPANATVVSINDSTVTLSAPATATNATASLTFAGSGALSVQSADAASFLPNANTVVIAIGRESSAIVGANSGQMLVRDNESKRLLGTGYVSTLRGPAGANLARNQAVYLSPGGNGTTSGSFYPCDASAANGATQAQFIGFAMATYVASTTAHIVSAGVVNGFSGLTVGAIYYLDPATPGAVTATQPTTAGLYAVPVGCAVTSTAMRINPSATHALAAIQNGLRVKGPLIVQPNASGNAFIVTAQDGSTIVGSVTDAGAFSAKSLQVSGSTSVADLTASARVSSPSFIATTGFKSHVPMGRWASSNYGGGSVSTNNMYYDGQQLSTRTYVFQAQYDGSIVAVYLDQKAPNVPTLTIVGVASLEGGNSASYTAYSGNPLSGSGATYRGGTTLTKGAAPLRQGYYYIASLSWGQTGFSTTAAVEMTIEYAT